MNFLKDWNQFWFGQYSPVPLGLCRIAIGWYTLFYALMLFPDRFIWFGPHGMFSATLMQEFGGRSLGPRPFDLFSYIQADWFVTVFFVVFLAASFCLMLGYKSRFSAFVTWVGLNALHLRAPVINNSGDILMLIMCFYLMIAPSGAACSVDRMVARWHGRAVDVPRTIDAWPVRLIQIQVCVIYFQSWSAKIVGNLWSNGTAVYYALNYPELHRFATPHFGANDIWLISLMTYFALGTEFAMATFVWVPKLRIYCLAAGVMLHGGIEYAMNIPLFSGLITSTYLAFLRPTDLSAFTRTIRTRLSFVNLKVVYDGDCDFCKSVIMLIHMLDPFRFVTLLNSTHPSDMETVSGVDISNGLEALVSIDSRGRHESGFYAVRELIKRLPALWVFIPFTYIPGVPFIGRNAYVWVTNNRSRLPVAAEFRAAGAKAAGRANRR